MRAADHNASGIIIVNYANQVVRMDMKQLIDQNKKIIALSMYKSTAIEIMMAMLDMNSTFYLELYPSVSLLSCLESVSNLSDHIPICIHFLTSYSVGSTNGP